MLKKANTLRIVNEAVGWDREESKTHIATLLCSGSPEGAKSLFHKHEHRFRQTFGLKKSISGDLYGYFSAMAAKYLIENNYAQPVDTYVLDGPYTTVEPGIGDTEYKQILTSSIFTCRMLELIEARVKGIRKGRKYTDKSWIQRMSQLIVNTQTAIQNGDRC